MNGCDHILAIFTMMVIKQVKEITTYYINCLTIHENMIWWNEFKPTIHRYKFESETIWNGNGHFSFMIIEILYD